MGDHIYTYIYICIYICVCISYTLTQSLSRSLAHIRRQLPSFISTHCHYRAHSVIRLLSLMSTHHGRTIVDIYTTRRTTAHFTSSRRLILFCFFSLLSLASMPTFHGRTVKPAPWEPATGPRCEHRFPTSHYHQCRLWSVTTCELCDRAVRPATRLPSVRSTDSIAVHAHIQP